MQNVFAVHRFAQGATGFIIPPHPRHFDRSEAEWRNLTPPWYRKHWGGRSLDSEYHGSGSCLFPIPACSSARDDGGSERPSRHVYKKGARLRRGLCRRVASHRENDSLHFVRRSAPSSTTVTDSLDFQVADAPLQIQLHSAKCVRCASLLFRGRGERALCSKSHKKRTPEGVLFFIPIRMRSSVRCPRCRRDLRCCRKLWLRSCSKRPVLRSSGVLRLRGLPRSVHRTSYPSRSPAGR